MPHVRLAAITALALSGCLIDRAPIGGRLDLVDAGREAPGTDAWLAPDLDAAGSAPDAADPELPDSAPDPDAWLAPPPDAYTPPDAYVGCAPTAEACNGRDDDCDGMVDEDVCGATLMGGEYRTCASRSRGSRTYLVCPFTARWDQARDLCRRWAPSYDLVAFADGAEQDVVRSWVDRSVWIGLTDSNSRVPAASDGDYHWVDGTSPSFTAWGAGEPYTDRLSGCVVLYMDGTWDAASCTYKYYNGIVCEAAIP